MMTKQEFQDAVDNYYDAQEALKEVTEEYLKEVRQLNVEVRNVEIKNGCIHAEARLDKMLVNAQIYIPNVVKNLED